MDEAINKIRNIYSKNSQFASLIETYNNRGLSAFFKQQQKLSSFSSSISIPTLDMSGLQNIHKLNSQIGTMTNLFNNKGMNKFFEKQQGISKLIDFSSHPLAKKSEELHRIFEPIIKQNQFLAEQFDSLQKIDKSFVDNFNKLEKNLKPIEFDKEFFDLDNVDSIVIQKDIETINNKIINKKILTKEDISLIVAILSFMLTLAMYLFPNNQQQTIHQTINNSITLPNKGVYYEVVKQVHVRKYPNSSATSEILDIVYPNQKLLIIEDKTDWIKVEYFNEKLQETIVGWVFKKYTKRSKE